MKIEELREAALVEKNLIGMTIRDVLITKDTPKERWPGHFFCYFKDLTSLVGAPRHVDGTFVCHNNQLTSLVGAPVFVGNDFSCYNNRLASLEGCPEHVDDGDFVCKDNRLETLHDIHRSLKHLGGHFIATNNPIKSHVLGVLLIEGVITVRLDGRRVTEILSKHVRRGRSGLIDCQTELLDNGFEEYAKL